MAFWSKWWKWMIHLTPGREVTRGCSWWPECLHLKMRWQWIHQEHQSLLNMCISAISVSSSPFRFGRKNAIVFFNCFRAAGGFLQVFSPTYEVLAVARFLIGVGVMGTYIAGYVLSKSCLKLRCFFLVDFTSLFDLFLEKGKTRTFLVGVEIVHPKHRIWYAVLAPLWYCLGYTVVPGMAYVIRDYEKLLLPPACATLVIFSYHWWVTVSPHNMWTMELERWKLGFANLCSEEAYGQRSSWSRGSFCSVKTPSLPPFWICRLIKILHPFFVAAFHQRRLLVFFVPSLRSHFQIDFKVVFVSCK